MFSFLSNITLKRRLKKTLERMKFKSNNPESKLYGYYGKVKNFETEEFSSYEIGSFQIREYKNINKIEFLFKHKKQLVLNKNDLLCIMEPTKINQLFDKTDDLTNNDTK